ncbi:hypothetical protein V7O66_13210 [Methanolobus sp. ZRKC3]|uniref:hypothetical protein n=1 Tax=Methanolobus sp. ZRKC3 TaxID=3125786 RepID=UPI00324E3F15
MVNNDVIEQVTSSIKEIKGVGEVHILTDEEREVIRDLELKADQMTLMGLGIGDNKGVKQVLENDVMMAFTTDMDYKWPPAPNVILMHEGCIVGEDIDDESKLEELENSDDHLVIGNIVLFDKSVLKNMNSANKPLVVVLPPKPCSEIEILPEACNAHLASPSPPSDEYIKERIGFEQAKGTGTFLLGFDFECSCE